MSQKSLKIPRLFKNKKRQPTNSHDEEREPKNPRIEINDDSAMVIDNETSLLLSSTPSPSSPNYHDSVDNMGYAQEDYGVSTNLKRMSLDHDEYDCDSDNDKPKLRPNMMREALSIAQSFEDFAPFIKTFLALGREITILYERAEHHKELCSFLLQRCNCAMAAVQDLDTRKTENTKFFSKQGNLKLFREFIKCVKRIKNFIEEVSQLGKIKKLFFTNSIDDNISKLVTEFDGYMNSLNFSFTVQAMDDFKAIKNETREIKDLLLNAYGVSDDKQSQQNFLDEMKVVTDKNKKFKQKKNLDSVEIGRLEEIEPLLTGSEFQKTKICPSKRIEKRIKSSFNDNCDEFCFKEFSNNAPSSLDESQIEIRRQVNILKDLKNPHIIKFFGVAHENSKYYLVTEWMEHGNLHEYYTSFKDSINLENKIQFALNICCGISYLHDCQILHHDIQSANILVSENKKVKITNFGLSRRFSDLTRNISPSIENVRYMAPEQLLTEESDGRKEKEKAPYDAKCEIYSVGALLWEIAELRKPHSDLNKSDILVGIRKRVTGRYCLPFSDGIPKKWKLLVASAMLHEPACRPKISTICHKLNKLSKAHSDYATLDDLDDCDDIQGDQNTMSSFPSFSTITILSVDDATRTHKSKNGNKQLAWQSFKYHSITNIYAKYMVGYYYYHEEVPELQSISKEERVRIAVEIFRETADKGNPSAQLRYGICLWQGEGVSANSFEAIRYLKLAAAQENAAAMYVIGKAYWNGGNGIDRNQEEGAKYLRNAALKNHQKAREMCVDNNINL